MTRDCDHCGGREHVVCCIASAHEALRLIPQAWDDDLHHLPGHAYTPGSSGKPSSKPPKGADVILRATLVTAARAIADAHHHLGAIRTPVKPWTPVHLGHRWTESTAEIRCAGQVTPCKHDARTVCGAEWDTAEHYACARRRCQSACTDPVETVVAGFRDRWTPHPTDLLCRPPQWTVIRSVCGTLSANLSHVETRDLTRTEQRALRRCLAAVGRAVRTLDRLHLLERPNPPDPVCVHCGEKDPEPGRKWCGRCRLAHSSESRECKVEHCRLREAA